MKVLRLTLSGEDNEPDGDVHVVAGAVASFVRRHDHTEVTMLSRECLWVLETPAWLVKQLEAGDVR